MKKLIILLSLSFFLTFCRNNNANLLNIQNIHISHSNTYGGRTQILPDINSIDVNEDFIVASSGKTSTVYIFDDSLSLITSFGTRGRGPKEISYPQSVLLDTANNIYVFDEGKRVILQFKTSGKFISESKYSSRIYHGKIALIYDSFYYHSMELSPITKVDLNGNYIKTFGSFYPSRTISKRFYNNSKIDILPFNNGIITINCQHAEINLYDSIELFEKKFTIELLEDFFSKLRSIYSKSTLANAKTFAIINILDSSIDNGNLFVLLSRTPEKPKEVVMNIIAVIDIENQELKYFLRLPDRIYQALCVKNKKCIAYSYDKSELQLFKIPNVVYE